MDDLKPIAVDTEGYEVMTKAVLEMMAQYSELVGCDIYFEELNKNSGIAFFADNSSLVVTEYKSITGNICQTCQYQFHVVYRTASTQELQKLQVQTFLDSLGKWICGEPAEVHGEIIRLKEYPALTQGRKIIRVTRLNSYGLEPNDEGVQDWILPITVQYTNKFEPIK